MKNRRFSFGGALVVAVALSTIGAIVALANDNVDLFYLLMCPVILAAIALVGWIFFGIIFTRKGEE